MPEEVKITPEMMHRGGMEADYSAGSYFSSAPLPLPGRWRFKMALDGEEAITEEIVRDYSRGEDSKEGGEWPILYHPVTGEPVVALRVTVKCTGVDPAPGVENVSFWWRLDGRIATGGRNKGKSELASVLKDAFGLKLLGFDLEAHKQLIQQTLAVEPQCYLRIDWTGEVPYKLLGDLKKEARRKVEDAPPNTYSKFPRDPATGRALQEGTVKVNGEEYEYNARVRVIKVGPVE